MAMLAEPRRKQKWTLNPRGKQWSEDSNKFGQKMLEKMGWTSGKGLGANEQGMTEHVRVRFKDDAGGIGYSKDDQDKYWTEHQENFNDFLQKLQTPDESSENNSLEMKKSTDLSGISLEIKSKQSRARVHYQKFTRGKDVNKYSSKDLANIFGRRDLEVTPQLPAAPEVTEEIPMAPIGTTDTSGGILTIKGGTISDYFKSKFPNFQTPKKNTKEEEKSSESESEKFGFGFTEKTPKKRKSEFYIETPNSKINEISPNAKKSKSNFQKIDFNSSKSENSNSKIMENSTNFEKENSEQLETENSDVKLKKKKKRENLNLEIPKNSETKENFLDVENSEILRSKKSKKKKRKELEPVECIPQISDVPSTQIPPKKPPRTSLKPQKQDSENSSPQKNSKKFGKKSKNCEAISENSEIAKSLIFEDPGLKLGSPEPEEIVLETPKSLKKNSKNDLEGFINPGLNLSSKIGETSILASGFEVSRGAGEILETPKQSKKKKKRKNEEAQEIGNDDSSANSKFHEIPTTSGDPGASRELPLESPKIPKKSKKKKTDCEGIANPCVNLNLEDDEISIITEKFGASRVPGVPVNPYEVPLEPPKIPKKSKKKKTDCDRTFNSSNSNHINGDSNFPANFQISGDPGFLNAAVDLSDELSCKKKVTFNDEVEFNGDCSKKKKRKLDKFEVDNEKIKKRKKRESGEGSEGTFGGFENKALDVEIVCEEIIDNEENERKILERKKIERKMRKRRISSLETIEEISEEGERGKIGEKNRENLGEVAVGGDQGDKFAARGDRSKKTLKGLFSKSPNLQFLGSNINEIRGYGLEL